MAITLTPEQEQQVCYMTELRKIGSPEEFLAQLLDTTYQTELYFEENIDEINAGIEEAWQEMERGEMLTPEEAKAQIEEMKREFLAKRSTA